MLTCPKLFLHSRTDETVPFDLAQRLYDAAAAPKRMVEIDGGHAGGLFADREAYADVWREFLAAHDLTPRPG